MAALMGSQVLISVRPGRTRAALVEGGTLIELHIYDDHRPSLVGNIYLGRVEKVMKSLAAAFVDLGGGVSGFLAAAEARPPGQGATAEISTYVREGEAIIVQVQRDAYEDKAPKLTARIAISGRAMILTPGDPAVRLSRRLNDKAERTRLETLAHDLARSDAGFVMRTAAQGQAAQALDREAQSLHRLWSGMGDRAKTGKAPLLLADVTDPVQQILRDVVPAGPGGQTRVIIDDPAALTRARAWCATSAADLADNLELYNGGGLLFDSIEEQLDDALSSALALPSGGSVLFAETPALVAMDVNVGKGRSVLDANLEAAALIARQVRLRNLSGLLVVDFVSTRNNKDQDKVLKALKRAVADDPANVFVGGFTRFGLLEMTRRRNRPTLSSLLLEPQSGPALNGLTAAHMALDRLAREAHANPADHLSLRAGPAIITALEGPARAALQSLNERFGRPFDIIADPDLSTDGFYIFHDSRDFTS